MPGEALLNWYEAVRRPLPWRFTRDPWALLVSEVMLQQTQAARVVPHYERFLARFPTPAACAEAPAAEVIAAWSGLGYNRRALALRAAARRGRGGRLAGGPAGAAGRRALHRGGRRLVRVGRAGGGGRHQRAPRDRAPRRRPPDAARARPPRGRAAARGARGRVEPGDDGARRDDLPPAPATLRRVPAAAGLRRPRRAAAARTPARRALRGLRPLGPRPAAGRAGGGGGAAAAGRRAPGAGPRRPRARWPGRAR